MPPAESVKVTSTKGMFELAVDYENEIKNICS
jgi:hypothetical protein